MDLNSAAPEAQSQLATLVQEAQSKGSGDEMFEQPEQQSTLHVFQGWLQQELHAHEERLRSGLREDLSHFFRQRPPHLAAQSQPQELEESAERTVFAERASPPRPHTPPSAPAAPCKPVQFEDMEQPETEDKDAKLPGMVSDEKGSPKKSRSRFASQTGAAVAQSRKSLKSMARGAGAEKVAPSGVVPDTPDAKLQSEEDMVPAMRAVERLRDFVRRNFVENTCFGYVIIAFIVLNAVMMGIQADWMVSNIGQTAPAIFDIFENIFAVIFTCELAMRIFVYHVHFFRTAEWKWNVFDSVVVALQLIDIVSTLAVGDENASADTGNLSFMRIIRLMRLLRILRLMRLLRFVQELRSMVMSIVASLKSLMWTIILLAFLMYGVGVCLTQMIADKGLEEPRIMLLSPDMKSHYGSLPQALVSLFAGITGGIDWADLMAPLQEQISPWLAAVFVLYIAFAVLAMMNVVTGIFVESALQSTRADEEKEVRAQLDEMFKHVDQEKNGTISWQEFVQSLENPDMRRCFESLGFNMEEDCAALFRILDDGDGECTLDEFIGGILRCKGPARAFDQMAMQAGLKQLDSKVSKVMKAMATAGLMKKATVAAEGMDSTEYITD